MRSRAAARLSSIGQSVLLDFAMLGFAVVYPRFEPRYVANWSPDASIQSNEAAAWDMRETPAEQTERKECPTCESYLQRSPR